MVLEDFWLRFYLRLEDYLRINNFSRINSSIKLITSLLRLDKQTRLGAYAYFLVNNHNSKYRNIFIEKALKIAKTYNTFIDINDNVKDHEVLYRSIIIKKYVNETERGILLISFESELIKIVLSKYFTQIENKYQIIFLPSWQPFYSSAF